MENTIPSSPQMILPSIHRLKCPKCGSGEYLITGTDGAMGKSIGLGAAFGAIGNLVASANSESDGQSEPLKYKCLSCKNKYVSTPLIAQPEEILEAPCNINFKRMSSFVGMAVNQIIWLNGIKIAPIKNGKDINFPTFVRYNTIFVTDHYGVAFKHLYKFEAQPNGNISVRFKRKFV